MSKVDRASANFHTLLACAVLSAFVGGSARRDAAQSVPEGARSLKLLNPRLKAAAADGKN